MSGQMGAAAGRNVAKRASTAVGARAEISSEKPFCRPVGLLASVLLLAAGCVPSVRFLRADCQVVKEGDRVKGVAFVAAVEARELVGEQLVYEVKLLSSASKPITSTNGRFQDAGGHVAARKTLMVTEPVWTAEDVRVSIPVLELELQPEDFPVFADFGVYRATGERLAKITRRVPLRTQTPAAAAAAKPPPPAAETPPALVPPGPPVASPPTRRPPSTARPAAPKGGAAPAAPPAAPRAGRLPPTTQPVVPRGFKKPPATQPAAPAAARGAGAKATGGAASRPATRPVSATQPTAPRRGGR